ncbi:hypothetical protein H6F89_31790 [Cyanobacteria bacterium FACHB-63]|nr:hypothetical protein [Cyanobacteria bacterium FACHB-63]
MASVISSANSQATQGEIDRTDISKMYLGKLQLFILAGQSNMSGLDEMPKSEMKTNSRIYMFGNDYR